MFWSLSLSATKKMKIKKKLLFIEKKKTNERNVLYLTLNGFCQYQWGARRTKKKKKNIKRMNSANWD